MNYYRKLKELIRLSDWKSEKMPFVFLVIFYIQLVYKLWGNGIHFYVNFFMILFFSLGYFAFLFLTNDLVDLEQDLKAGKEKPFKSKDKPVLWLFSVLMVIFAGAAFYWVYGKIDITSSLVLISGFLIAFYYSVPPFRFKESGLLGIIFGSLVLRPIPIIMISAFIPKIWFDPGFIAIFCWIEILSINKIIRHQLDDYENDTKSKTNTFTTDIGFDKALKLRGLMIPFETLFLGLAAYFMISVSKLTLLAFMVYSIYHIILFVYDSEASNKYFKSKRINVFDLSVIIFPIFFSFQLAFDQGLLLLPIFMILWQRYWIKDSFSLVKKV